MSGEGVMNDMELVLQAKTDPTALARLVEGSQDFVWSILYRHFGAPRVLAVNLGCEIDDLFQAGMEGFLRAVRGFDPAKGKFTSYAWSSVLASVRHLVRTLRRLNGGESAVMFSLENEIAEHRPLMDVIPALVRDPEEEALFRAALADALASLPERNRVAVALCLTGLSQTEAAAVAGVSQALVSRNLQRLRSRLK